MEGSRSETEDGKDGLNISYFTSRKNIEIVMKLSCEENVSFTCPTWRDTWNELETYPRGVASDVGRSGQRRESSISFSLKCCLQESISRTCPSDRSRGAFPCFSVSERLPLPRTEAHRVGVYMRGLRRSMRCRRVRVALCTGVNVDITCNCTYVRCERKFRWKYDV